MNPLNFYMEKTEYVYMYIGWERGQGQRNAA